MEYARDADGFAVPPTPSSTGSAADNSRMPYNAPSVASSNISGVSATSSRKKSLVEDSNYREMNLAANNIYMRPFYEEFPKDIARLVNYVGMDRDSPGPSSDQLRQDTDLYDLEMGAAEGDVEKYFRTNLFPNPKLSESLKRSDRLPVSKHAVPDVGSKLKISNPVPDMLYGYSRNGAFFQQQAQLLSMGTEMVANSQGLIYPFLVIEFKADGPSAAGSLWVATNQCLGSSALCVNIAERFNRQLKKCKNNQVQPIDSAAFSIAMNATEARLYISWKHNELEYYTRKVNSFLLQRPDHFLEFRKYVRNIIDWGKVKRLTEIQDSLDLLFEENRKTASKLARSRTPPSRDI